MGTTCAINISQTYPPKCSISAWVGSPWLPLDTHVVIYQSLLVLLMWYWYSIILPKAFNCCIYPYEIPAAAGFKAMPHDVISTLLGTHGTCSHEWVTWCQWVVEIWLMGGPTTPFRYEACEGVSLSLNDYNDSCSIASG